MTFATKPHHSPAPGAAGAPLRPSITAAVRAYDILQGALVDHRPFTAAIVREISPLWGRPRMLDLWCGTGVPVWDVLAAVPTLDYHGVDPVPEMVRVFRKKTIQRACRQGTISFTTPADPSAPTTPADAYNGTADIVLLCRALQGVPLVPNGGRTQAGVLKLAAELTREKGKLFVIEEIYGASAEEQEHFEWTADEVARQRIMERHAPLIAHLAPLDADLADLVRRVAAPAVVREIRARAVRFRERYRLPLGVWYRVVASLGLQVRATPHPALPGLYLFTLSRS